MTTARKSEIAAGRAIYQQNYYYQSSARALFYWPSVLFVNSRSIVRILLNRGTYDKNVEIFSFG
jgi:hypothetical protein